MAKRVRPRADGPGVPHITGCRHATARWPDSTKQLETVLHQHIAIMASQASPGLGTNIGVGRYQQYWRQPEHVARMLSRHCLVLPTFVNASLAKEPECCRNAGIRDHHRSDEDRYKEKWRLVNKPMVNCYLSVQRHYYKDPAVTPVATGRGQQPPSIMMHHATAGSIQILKHSNHRRKRIRR